MYSGTYYHLIEAKGRIAVPAKFREKLGKNPILTRGLDGCLFLYSQQTWKSFIKTLEDSSVTKKTHRDFIRLMTNEAVELELDAQGRMLLPEALQQQANLTKNVVFAGSLDHIELWDRETYHSYMSNLEKNAETIAEHYDTQLPGKQGMHA